jgi:hypothetical protein
VSVLLISFTFLTLSEMTNNIKTWTDDFSTLVERYAEFVMDSMDMKTMEQFVFDTLVQQYNDYSEEELITEIREYYDDEWFENNGIELKETPEV